VSTLTTPRVSRRSFWAAGLVVSLLVAAVLSFYASSHPDGLEFVAEKAGFIVQAEDSAASESPLADYGVAGVDDERVSTGLAGVAGSLVVLAVAGGLALALRRRTHDDSASDSGEA
jgi:cobalt/nickel transport protein